MRSAGLPGILGAALALLLLSSGVVAQASEFAVAPDRVFLSSGNATGEITVLNQTAQALTVSVAGYAWSETKSGRQQLSASDEIVAFPAIMTLAPLEERTIRVGLTAAAGPIEKTFRVIVTELASPQIVARGRSFAVHMLAAFSVPVFLTPEAGKAAYDIADPSVSHSTFSFVVANTGNVHILPQKAQVDAVDGAGRVIWTKVVSGWYVLAHSERSFTAALPRSVCGSVRELRVHITGENLDAKRAFTNFARTCQP